MPAGPRLSWFALVALASACGDDPPVNAASTTSTTVTSASTSAEGGASYEWFAVVQECGAKVTTPTQKFTVN